MTAPIICIDWARAFRSAPTGWLDACGIWRIELERMDVPTADWSMGLYLREYRGVLVTLGGQAKNSDNAPKGFPGAARGIAAGSTSFRDHHRHCDDRNPLTPSFVRQQGGLG